MSTYIDVPEVAWKHFIFWYSENIDKKSKFHSVTPADRLIVLNSEGANIGYIEFYMETRYYAKEEHYKKFANT